MAYATNDGQVELTDLEQSFVRHILNRVVAKVIDDDDFKKLYAQLEDEVKKMSPPFQSIAKTQLQSLKKALIQ